MLRRYLVAFVGAAVGGGVAARPHRLAPDPGPDCRAAAARALAAAGFPAARGEGLGPVPPSEGGDNPPPPFTDEGGRRR